MQTKVCTKCGEELPLESFPIHTKGKPYRRGICRQCKNNYSKEYHEKHKERLSQQQREYRANMTPEQLERQREVNRRSYRKHREKRIAACKEYQEKNPDLVRARIKDWERRNPGKVTAKARRYRQSKKGKRYFRKWREDNIDKVRKTQRRSKRKWRRENPEAARQYDREYRQREKAKKTDAACGHRKRARKKKAPGKFTRKDMDAQYTRQSGKCFWCKDDISDEFHIDHYIPLSRGGTNYPDNIVLACPSCNIHRANKMPKESLKYLKNNVWNHRD